MSGKLFKISDADKSMVAVMNEWQEIQTTLTSVQKKVTDLKVRSQRSGLLVVEIYLCKPSEWPVSAT